jgi:hypothetical protein
MNAKEFLKEKNLTAIEIANNLVLNLIVDGTTYGIDVDTSNISFGTVLNRTENFSINGDVLTIENTLFDLNLIEMLEIPQYS